MKIETARQNYDSDELAKFASLAAHWWDPMGDLKTLHHINPVRSCYIAEKCDLENKTVLDVGCGGGLLTESLAAKGAKVTGIDLNGSLVEVAKLHLLESKLDIEYQKISAEAHADERPGYYDVLTCLEMLEHVPDPGAIVKACAKLVKPGGQLFFSTINRNPKAYLAAIVAAEYVLKLLPKNTHDYAKFIRPSELSHWARACELMPEEIVGLNYQPFSGIAKLTADVSVNYIFYCKRP